MKITPGPWWWADNGRGPFLMTPDRGRLVVMEFARHGMRGVMPRFAVMEDDQPRGRRGGILQDFPFPDQHPDGRLIACAPELYAALRDILGAQNAGAIAATLLPGTKLIAADAFKRARAVLAKIDFADER